MAPVVTEATTLRKMMMICNGLGFTHLNFEGDCMIVVQATQGIGEGFRDLGSLIFYIHLLQQFLGWMISYAHRETKMMFEE